MTRAPSFAGLPLGEPVSIAQLVATARRNGGGWQELSRRSAVQKMRREIFKLNRAVITRYEETHDAERWHPTGILLEMGRQKYVRSIAELRRYGWSDFGKRFWAPEDADEVKIKLTRTQRELRAAMRRIRDLEAFANLATEAFQGMKRDLQAWVEGGGRFPTLTATPAPFEEDDAPEPTNDDEPQTQEFRAIEMRAARRGIM